MQHQKTCVLLVSILAAIATPPASAEFDFSPRQRFQLLGSPEAVKVGDFDGDGRDDVLATIHETEGGDLATSIMIMRQLEDGTLDEPVYYASPSIGGPAIATGQLDRDRANEIAFGGFAVMDRDAARGEPVVRLRTKAGIGAARIELIDVNRDGALDVVAKPFGPDIAIGIGDGHGGISRIKYIPLPISNYVDASSGDFNGDGHQDFVVLSSVFRAYVYLNNGTDGFAHRYVLNPNPTGGSFYPAVAGGDFNADGRDDLVFITNSGQLSLYAQNTSGQLAFSRHLATDFFTSRLLVHDVNLDGRSDLLAAHPDIGLFEQGDDGLRQERPLMAGAATFSGMGMGDLNGDGCPDLASASSTGDEILVFLGHGCPAAADLYLQVALPAAAATVVLANAGPEAAGAAAVQMTLSTSTGLLSTGSLPQGCTEQRRDPRTVELTCMLATLAPEASHTFHVPIDVATRDSRNVIALSATATTDSIEWNLRNNDAEATRRASALAHDSQQPARR